MKSTMKKISDIDRIKVAVKSDDIVLRDPRTGERVTTAGKVVVKNPFWIRRLKAGDVVLIEEKSQPKFEEEI